MAEAIGEMEGVNFEAQSNLLEALFEAVWTEPWFLVVFRKWHPNEGAGRHRDDTQFSPQNKPALEKVETYYALKIKSNVFIVIRHQALWGSSKPFLDE